MRFLENSLPKYTAWLLPLIVLGAIFLLRPHWGLMDDVTNVYTMIPKMREVGVFHHGWIYGMGDLSWGMFRPTYPPMVYLVYAPGVATASWITFAWNALLVMGVVYFYARVLAGILNISFPLLLLGCGAFFYGHDLFQHPSLQEKMLLLAGAGLTSHLWNRRRWNGFSFWLVALAWILFGACVKASFVIHYCVALMAFLAGNADALKRKEAWAWAEAAVLATIGAVMVLAFAYISKHGGYTSQYSSANILPNLKTIQGPFFLIPISAALAWCAWHWRETWAHPEVLLPVTGVSAYLTIFASWGIGGYVQSVITPLYAALVIQLCGWYLQRLPRPIWITGIVLLGIGVTSYRSFVNFGRLHDVGAIVANAAELERKGATELWMPCNEGSLSMERFFREANTKISVKEISPRGPTQGKTLLYDQSMCPFDGRVSVPADCRDPEMILPGLFAKSYRVLRCH